MLRVYRGGKARISSDRNVKDGVYVNIAADWTIINAEIESADNGGKQIML